MNYAVFEVKPESLVWSDGAYQAYAHKQRGIVLFTIIPILAACLLVFSSEVKEVPSIVLGVVFGLLTVIAFLFTSITIEVNESEVSWFFGPGAFQKELLLEEIGQCK